MWGIKWQDRLHNFDSVLNCPERCVMAESADIIPLDLNISFLLTICSYHWLPARPLPSSQPALRDTWYHISIMIIMLHQEKKNSLCGATTMSNIQLEVSTASTLMCATPCKDEMESDLLAVSSQHCCYWVRCWGWGRGITSSVNTHPRCTSYHLRVLITHALRYKSFLLPPRPSITPAIVL